MDDAPKTYIYDYPRPSLTADVILGRVADGRLEILLIKRGRAPFAGRWSLPGGFVGEGELPPDAAKRELREETGMTARRLWPIGVFAKPGRDPRGWTVSAAYYGFVVGAGRRPNAGDDAAETSWRPVPTNLKLAFDHRDIVAAYRRRLRRDLYAWPVLANLMPTQFPIEQLAETVRVVDPDAGINAVVARKLQSGPLLEPVPKEPTLYRFRKA